MLVHHYQKSPAAHLYLLLGSLFILSTHCSNEIITIQTSDNISCITEDISINHPIFASPPVPGKFKLDFNIFEKATWTNDDWLIKNASSPLQGPITDKRWEDFEIQYTNYQNFTDVSSLSFSIYSPPEIRFYISDDDSTYHTVINETHNEAHYKQEKWKHFSIILSDQNVYIYENGKQILSVNSFNPNQFVIKTNNNTYWKIHEYTYKWSKTVQNEIATTLTVPPSGRSCIMLYVSLCEDCILNVGTVSGTIDIQSTNKSESLMVSWQSYKIDVKPELESTITLHRGKITESVDETDYWGVDIRQCPVVKNNKVINTIQLATVSNQNRTCTFLREPDESKIFKRNANEEKLFKCAPGELGSKCDIKCEEVLGSGSSHCERCRICENSNCSCAWGFHGRSCQQSCQPGTWGLSCERTCNSTCQECDKITGKCLGDCEPGTWGDFCEKKCQPGCKACDKDKGQCLSKDCEPGASGDSCEKGCQSGCETCDKKNGQCVKEGKWASYSTVLIVAIVAIVAAVTITIAIIVLKRMSHRTTDVKKGSATTSSSDTSKTPLMETV